MVCYNNFEKLAKIMTKLFSKNSIFTKIVILIMAFALLMPSFAFAKCACEEDTYLVVISTDENGTKIDDVKFNIYRQETDINGEKYLGQGLGRGHIGKSGSQEVKIKICNETETLAIEYYRGNNKAEKQYLWDIKVNCGDKKEVHLYLSSVSIVLKDASNELLKDTKFDIYSTIKDYNNKTVANERLFSNIKTGNTGQALLHLSEGTYMIRINPSIRDLDSIEKIFTIQSNKQTKLVYTLSTIKVSVLDSVNDVFKRSTFKLYVLKNVDGISYYRHILTDSTPDYGYKTLFVPAGDYRIEIEDSQRQFSNEYEFTLTEGVQKSIIHSADSIKLQILDPSRSPVEDRLVTIYEPSVHKDKKGEKVFKGITDEDGYVEFSLSESGMYSLEVEGILSGANYFKKQIYFDQTMTRDYRYTLSTLVLYLEKDGQLLTNQNFKIYATDEYFGVKSDLVASFYTNSQGYKELFLPPEKFYVEVKDYGLYPIQLSEGIENSIHVNLNTPATSTTSGLTTPQTVNQPSSAPANAIQIPISSIQPHENDLYLYDADNDGLSDFEEENIYRTSPFTADSDNDGYEDRTEIINGYNPNGTGKFTYASFSYGKPRASLSVEKAKADFLKQALKEKTGQDQLKISSQNWHTVVNAYIYGGYTIDELAAVISYGAPKAHPSIPASAWRKSADYQTLYII